MITAPDRVLGHQPLNRSHVEVLLNSRGRPTQTLDAMSQGAPEPLRQRHRKPSLWSRQYEVWNNPANRPPEKSLALAGCHPQVARYAQRELDQITVEQRHTCLKRNCHAGAINLGEDVTWKIGLEIEAHHRRCKILRFVG